MSESHQPSGDLEANAQRLQALESSPIFDKNLPTVDISEEQMARLRKLNLGAAALHFVTSIAVFAGTNTVRSACCTMSMAARC